MTPEQQKRYAENRKAINKGQMPFHPQTKEQKLADKAKELESAITIRDTFKNALAQATDNQDILRIEALSVELSNQQKRCDDIALAHALISKDITKAEHLPNSSVSDLAADVKNLAADIGKTDAQRKAEAIAQAAADAQPTLDDSQPGLPASVTAPPVETSDQPT